MAFDWNRHHRIHGDAIEAARVSGYNLYVCAHIAKWYVPTAIVLLVTEWHLIGVLMITIGLIICLLSFGTDLFRAFDGKVKLREFYAIMMDRFEEIRDERLEKE
jgi:hypothetical protein